MRIEVRAVGLKAMRRKRHLTQRELAHQLGVHWNYIPAIENGVRRAGPKLREQMIEYFGCTFNDLFQVVLVYPESGREQVIDRPEDVPTGLLEGDDPEVASR